MVINKHADKIIIAIVSVAVILCFLAVTFAGRITAYAGGTGVNMEYESKLFDTDEIITIDISMEEDEWEKMLENALTEEYYVCDVKVNGVKFSNVAIRPKGNTSLSAIVSDPDSDRYSLKLEFDHYTEGQTCFGLDKLILNNNYADATNMKEALIYDMYNYLGATSSLYNYAEVSLNGEYIGVYLALEGVEQSFMLRNFGTQDGELYKPDSMEMGGGDAGKKSGSSGSGGFGGAPGGMPGGDSFSGGPGGFGGGPSSGDGEMPDMSSFNPGDMEGFDPGNVPQRPDSDNGDSSESRNSERPSSGKDREESSDSGKSERPSFGGGGGGFGGFSMGGNGANLNYTDDELDSYETIWDGALTDSKDSDHRRVVTALKNISEGNDLEEYLNVDNILKYMAVHTFSVNMDSLSGSMAHNYYLYEYDGMLDIFPWDYNLSFGGMSMGGSDGATDMINDAIDTPFSGTEFFDALLESEEYLAKYHEYLNQLVEEYVYGGRFDEVYNRIRSQIDSLVETDPTAFYNYEEYQTAADMLYQTILLRAESIRGQLDGSIPSTDEGQREDTSSLIDGSSIDVSAMGQFNMGGAKDEDSGRKKDKKAMMRGFGPGQGSDSGSFTPPGMSGTNGSGTVLKTLILYGGLLALVLAAMAGTFLFRRRRC